MVSVTDEYDILRVWRQELHGLINCTVNRIISVVLVATWVVSLAVARYYELSPVTIYHNLITKLGSLVKLMPAQFHVMRL